MIDQQQRRGHETVRHGPLSDGDRRDGAAGRH